MSAPPHVLRVDDIRIGRYTMLHGVSLRRAGRRRFVLLGRNGAGKTTTLRAIMGLVAACAGRGLVREPRHHRSAHRRYRAAAALPMFRKTWVFSAA